MSKVQQKQLKRLTEIIETAIRLMNDTPFDALSVSDICEAADISIGSFYHYFSRKSDLLVGLLSLVDEALEETVFPSLTHPDQREDLRLLARGFASYIQGNDLERSRLIAAIEPFDTDLSGRPRALVVKVAELFRRGQEVEQITRSLPAEELTRLYLIALRGVSVDWTRHNGSYDLLGTMDTFLSLFLRSVSPTEEERAQRAEGQT